MAAEALKITARDLSQLGIIDEIIPEPEGGAHLDHDASAALVDRVLERSLRELLALKPSTLIEQRYEKFRRMGQFFESGRN
jgi:acetyl-CoA carboxylase carboxyl transferase subunit alpha